MSENMRDILKKTGVLLVCTSMTLCAFGCGSSEIYESAESDGVSESETMETIDVTFVNKSGKPIDLLSVLPLGGSFMSEDIINGDPLEDGEMVTASLEKIDETYVVYVFSGDDYLYGDAMNEVEWNLADNSLMIFPEEYAGDAMVYPGTEDDLDEAMAIIEQALAEGGAADSDTTDSADADSDTADGSAAQEGEIEPDADMVAAFLEAENFDGTLADYRIWNHDPLIYTESVDTQVAYPELIGYWYPEGNQDSAYYFAIDKRSCVYFYRFGPDGDEMESYTEVKSRKKHQYTLADGRVFTYTPDTDLLYDNSEIVFDGSSVVYRPYAD